MLSKKLSASLIFLLIIFTASSSYSAPAEKVDPVLKAWYHETEASSKEGDQSLKLRITYYSNEYIDNLIASEAEKNLWTADETENFKYTFLKNLNLSEAIPFHVDLYVTGTPMYAGPFDKHITMMVGGKKYQPVDYDKRFNFKILGARDGMVFFPRYDPKTGKEILDGAKDVRIIFDSSISHALDGRSDVIYIWDLKKDRGSITAGKAVDRLETDRLIKRADKIKTERDALQKQIDAALKKLETKQYDTIADFIDDSYTNGYTGVMYDLQKQGIPLTIPIDQKQVAKAVQIDSKISKGMYTRLGEDVTRGYGQQAPSGAGEHGALPLA